MNNRKLKILVIEDDEYSRNALAHLLSAEGYTAESVKDGETGYRRAREIHPDIIVLDLGPAGVTQRCHPDGPS